MNLDHKRTRYPLMAQEWNLSDFKRITKDTQALTNPENKAWAISYVENHDQAVSPDTLFASLEKLTIFLFFQRCISRFGSDSPKYRVSSGKMLATYLLTLSGTIIIYQGRE